jgi:hypothetical protein
MLLLVYENISAPLFGKKIELLTQSDKVSHISKYGNCINRNLLNSTNRRFFLGNCQIWPRLRLNCDAGVMWVLLLLLWSWDFAALVCSCTWHVTLEKMKLAFFIQSNDDLNILWLTFEQIMYNTDWWERLQYIRIFEHHITLAFFHSVVLQIWCHLLCRYHAYYVGMRDERIVITLSLSLSDTHTHTHTHSHEHTHTHVHTLSHKTNQIHSSVHCLVTITHGCKWCVLYKRMPKDKWAHSYPGFDWLKLIKNIIISTETLLRK